MSTQQQQSRQRRALAQRRAELDQWENNSKSIVLRCRNGASAEDKIKKAKADIAALEGRML